MPAPASSTAIGLKLPNQPGDGGGQSEDAAADDGIDHQRGEAPAADGANQAVAGSAGWGRFGHRVVLSQREDRSVTAAMRVAGRHRALIRRPRQPSPCEAACA